MPRAAGIGLGVLLSFLVLPGPAAGQAGAATQPDAAGQSEAAGDQPVDMQRAKQEFETHCGVCHSLDLPRNQRLDRQNWKWVIDDMVNTFGATWLTEEQQALILEYLVENYGPKAPRQRR